MNKQNQDSAPQNLENAAWDPWPTEAPNLNENLAIPPIINHNEIPYEALNG